MKRQTQTNERTWRFRLAYLAVLVAIVPITAWNGFVGQFNAAMGDLLFRLRPGGAAAATRDIVLVAIDDRTAANYGPLPIRRSVLAKGIARIASGRPKALAVDLLFSESSSDDAELASVLRGFRGVVLSAALDLDGKWILPVPALRQHATIGHVHAAPDPDGVVRSVLLAKLGEGRRLWALGLESAAVALGRGRPVETKSTLVVGDISIPAPEHAGRSITINYAGPEGSFERVSFSDLLGDKIDAARFHDRVVILGVSAQGAGDRLFTPFSSGIGMSGVEIHANIVHTILDRAFMIPMSLPAEVLCYVLLASGCMVSVLAFRGLKLIVVLAALSVAIPAGSLVALSNNAVWPVGSMLAVFTVAAGTAVAGEYGLIARALRRSEEKRRDYAFRVQAIAHEIKTPLTAIQGSSEMIADEIVPDRERVEMASLIHKESKRLTHLIHTFLDVERMASGSIQLETQPVSLEALCNDLVERAWLYAARKNIRIEASIQPITIEADADLLSFAIYNLLTNAVKYSPNDTTIVLATAVSNASVSISVTDQGYGIAPEDQQRIFERFYRLKRDRKGEEEGTGIGLALAKEIVVQHGGLIRVDSKPGAGSRFTLSLPYGSQ
ncbi:MAG: CHASE2 domain-containing protein [Bryobacteraceae bacterium]|nr:CHASE2 domain-containing protein [Bryobacteraceae bacterium]